MKLPNLGRASSGRRRTIGREKLIQLLLVALIFFLTLPQPALAYQVVDPIISRTGVRWTTTPNYEENHHIPDGVGDPWRWACDRAVRRFQAAQIRTNTMWSDAALDDARHDSQLPCMRFTGMNVDTIINGRALFSQIRQDVGMGEVEIQLFSPTDWKVSGDYFQDTDPQHEWCATFLLSHQMGFVRGTGHMEEQRWYDMKTCDLLLPQEERQPGVPNRD